MRILLVGGGRMGLRHLQALISTGTAVDVVDPRPEARSDVEALGANWHETIAEALAAARFDGAVLAETAAGRLERVASLAAAGIGQMLLEKPLEQSRARVHALAGVVSDHDIDARVNHYFRTLPLFEALRAAGGPFQLSVVGGAFGLACNGIHWIDLAVYLGGDEPGRLLFGELDSEPIASGRGASFCDYGGRALFGLGGGSTLYLSSAAVSSAPIQATIVQPTRETVFFPHEARAELAIRDAASEKPAYLYGADYERRGAPALTSEDLFDSTRTWARALGGEAEHRHAAVALSVSVHDLLFDLLETGGETDFAIT